MSKLLILLALSIAVLSLLGCGAKPEPTPTSVEGLRLVSESSASVDAIATPTMQPVSPESSVTTVPTVAAREESLPTATPTQAPTTEPTATPTQTRTTEKKPPVAPAQRKTGEYSGFTFNVGEGSSIVFKVREQLLKLSFPIYATLRTDQLKGKVLLDGGRSSITLDLHSLKSDASGRDRYVRRRMFPNDRFATLVVERVSPLPDGFSVGQEVKTQSPAVLTIKGVDVPLIFDITAQDQGDWINISGRTEVTWEELHMPKPTARSVLSVEDEVTVEVELVVRP